MGTLTGAARVALGPELPPFYTDDEALAAELARHAAAENDPLWRLPLWQRYDQNARFQGRRRQQRRRRRHGRLDHLRAVPQALRLGRESWLHFDIYAWTPAAKPGRPEGGECQAARALYALLCSALRLTTMRRDFDPRITPARPDLAAAHLRGKVEAARFVEGTAQEVVVGARAAAAGAVARRAAAHRSAGGERVTVYETNDEGWAWGQLEADGYVGWLPAAALLAPGAAPTHKVAALRTLVFPGPSIKLPPIGRAAARRAARRRARAGQLCRHGFGRLSCRSAISRRSTPTKPDFVAVAERFLGVPYLWGGKSSLGLDCSGLVQVALTACGITCPRDSDMQESALGKPVKPRRPAKRRSDLLEGPRRHRARPQQHDPRQRLPHGGGDRAGGRGDRRASAPPAARSPA